MGSAHRGQAARAGKRAAGYDVLAVTGSMPSTADIDLITLAAEQQRILLTEDKDFWWLGRRYVRLNPSRFQCASQPMNTRPARATRE